MDNAINVCICVPASFDNRSPEEQTATLNRFHQLDSRLQFRFVEYTEAPDVRTLRSQPDFDSARDLAAPPSTELLDVLAHSEIIFCLDLPFDMDKLAPKLRWVQAIGAGVGQLQSCGLDRLECKLTNGAGIVAAPIAEFVIARILSHWKHFEIYRDNQQRHQWKPVFGRRLSGCVLGIVGFGAIGSATAQRAKALGMTVLAASKHTRPDATNPSVDRFFPVNELDTMLECCDAVLLCTAETSDTYHLFNAARFAAMREGSYFCNVSRGSLVDEHALIDALQSGHLAAAGIDVMSIEPLPAENPLWDAPNLAISPHSSASLDTFIHDAWQLFYENMRLYLNGQPLENLCAAGYQ